MTTEAPSDPIYVLAPVGRDGPVIADMIGAAGLRSRVVRSFAEEGAPLEDGAGLIVAAEAFDVLDSGPLRTMLAEQPPWSDFPIVFLRSRAAPVTPRTQAFIEALGNVTILERPLHPITLLSAARSVVRARRRQREAEGAADQLERRVDERTAELAAANRQLLSEMSERERVEETMMRMQRLEAVGQLTAGVAHDFNNLLTVVLGNLSSIEKRAGADDRRRLAMMRIAAERGAKLTGQLLAFSRRQRLEPKPTSLNEAILSLRDLLQSTLGAAATLEARLERKPWPALVDPTQIEMIILNLAINARDAMSGGGVIRLETENVVLRESRTRPEEPEPGEYVVLSVADTGAGMTPEVLQQAFEPFFTTKEVGRGSGLGLSQVLGFASSRAAA
jgi:signal transduction histidine kinase